MDWRGTGGTPGTGRRQAPPPTASDASHSSMRAVESKALERESPVWGKTLEETVPFHAVAAKSPWNA